MSNYKIRPIGSWKGPGWTNRYRIAVKDVQKLCNVGSRSAGVFLLTKQLQRDCAKETLQQ